jgi:membrane-associated phospholipid phosphatase
LAFAGTRRKDLLRRELKNGAMSRRFFLCSSILFFLFFGSMGHAWSQINYPFRAFDRYLLRKVEENKMHKKEVDNYLQYAPIVAAYGLGFCGVPSKHDWIDRTYLTASSLAIMEVCVQTLKSVTRVKRPDSNKYNSFPSGHTGLAFTGAQLLFKEYKDVSPWIGVAGYMVATTTGAMRIINRRHWFSDVIAGAGIGILSVQASYALLPVFHRIRGIPKNMALAPAVCDNSYGLTFAYSF